MMEHGGSWPLTLQKHRPKTIRERPGASLGWSRLNSPGGSGVLCVQPRVSSTDTRGSRVPRADIKGWGGVSALETGSGEFGTAGNTGTVSVLGEPGRGQGW